MLKPANQGNIVKGREKDWHHMHGTGVTDASKAGGSVCEPDDPRGTCQSGLMA
jgi:hypothetical protein